MREPSLSTLAKRGRTYTNRTARAGAILLALSLIAVGPVAAANAALPPGGTFVDDNGNVHEANIEAIAAAGITKGCNPPTNNRYCPDSSVTRGQMAAFLRRAFKLPASSTDYFVDDNDSIFEGDINAVAAAGITKGCNPPANNRFCPDGNVTRGQMAAFLRRTFRYPAASKDYFTDDEGSIFEADINAIARVGVTKGCNPPANDRYCPSALVRRDQMASFLARALGLTPITPPPPSGGGEFTAMFVAVRQGDAAVFVGACGDTGVIDANRFRTAEILTAIDQIGSRTLKWMAVTHYDADHLGDIVSVATSPGVTVGRFYDRGGNRTVKDSNTYRNYYDHVTAAGNRSPLDIGGTMTLCSGADRVTFTVASAGTDGTAAGGVPVTEENDRGLCFHVEYHDFDMVVCSDINGVDTGSRTDVESAVAPVIGDVEVVKVNHHGSSYSSNATYVNTLRPEVAVISVGKNSFGHPSQAVVDRWDAHAEVFQTQSPVDNAMIDGNIAIVTTGVTTYTAMASASPRTVTRLMDEDGP
jgi:beta-lactamase superfamily II metal-dependent hydrolase